jgi:predicted nucleic acid-binding protein
MLFDTSIWIDYLKNVHSHETSLLDKELARYKNIEAEICPPIFQEILQGIRSDVEYESIKDLLLTVNFLNLDGYHAAEGGAKIYRDLRKKGITMQKPNDCIIAFYAIHFNLKLVHSDSDFDKIAKHTNLKVYKK